MNKKSIVISAALLLLEPLVANATPLTFDFITPGWTTNTSPALFGTGLSLSITVDNGGSSNVNQSFDFSNISSIDVAAIGGSYHNLYDTTPATVTDNVPVITTNSLGEAVLRLGNQNGADGVINWYGSAIGEFFQLGQLSATGGPLPLYLTTGNYEARYYLGYYNTTGYLPININSQTASTIPEPGTFALFGLGVIGLYRSYRKA